MRPNRLPSAGVTKQIVRPQSSKTAFLFHFRVALRLSLLMPIVLSLLEFFMIWFLNIGGVKRSVPLFPTQKTINCSLILKNHATTFRALTGLMRPVVFDAAEAADGRDIAVYMQMAGKEPPELREYFRSANGIEESERTEHPNLIVIAISNQNGRAASSHARRHASPKAIARALISGARRQKFVAASRTAPCWTYLSV
jgi:hypothetical protein